MDYDISVGDTKSFGKVTWEVIDINFRQQLVKLQTKIIEPTGQTGRKYEENRHFREWVSNESMLHVSIGVARDFGQWIMDLKTCT